MDAYRCCQPSRPLDAVVEIPGSKSLTNRALIAAALADGSSHLLGALLADDTRWMIEALRALGIQVAVDEARAVIDVTGCAGHVPVDEADLYCGNSGTTLRFCLALCATGFGAYRIDGSARMRRRPVGPLVDALRVLGARVQYLGEEGFPPLEVQATHLQGGRLALDASASSQFASALLLAAPCALRDMFLEILPPITSAPYLEITVAVMRSFGVELIADSRPCAQGSSMGAPVRFIVPALQRYTGCTYPIEPDASNACYFLAAPALAGGRVTVKNLGAGSVQGDARFADVLERMGCGVQRQGSDTTVPGPPEGQPLRALSVDLNDMPDQVQTLAALALFADGPTTIRNVANLRIKETDRLASLSHELSKLGAKVEVLTDGLRIEPPQACKPATIDTYDDHRMAMSFALAGLRIPGMIIRDPDCCAKTFPEFFAQWERLMA